MFDQIHPSKIDHYTDGVTSPAFTMAVLLIGSLLNAFLALIFLFRGRIAGGPFSLIVALVAFWCVARFADFGWTVRIGVAIIGLGAALRACVYYLHASRDIQDFAAINGRMLSIVGCTLVVVGAILWFRARRSDTRSDSAIP